MPAMLREATEKLADRQESATILRDEAQFMLKFGKRANDKGKATSVDYKSLTKMLEDEIEDIAGLCRIAMVHYKASLQKQRAIMDKES